MVAIAPKVDGASYCARVAAATQPNPTVEFAPAAKKEGGLKPPSDSDSIEVSAIVVVSEIEQIEEIANGRAVLWYVRIVAV